MPWKYVIFILSVVVVLTITDSRFDYTLSSTRASSSSIPEVAG
jgi:hypothetical protein